MNNTTEYTLSIALPPSPKWTVTIPRDGDLTYYTATDLTLWQRFWMRFIGWGMRML